MNFFIKVHQKHLLQMYLASDMKEALEMVILGDLDDDNNI